MTTTIVAPAADIAIAKMVISNAVAGMYLGLKPIETLRSAITTVETSAMADVGSWPAALRKAKWILGRLLEEAKTEAAQADFYSAHVTELARAAKREREADKFARREKNRRDQAERNRAMAKDSGAGTKKK